MITRYQHLAFRTWNWQVFPAFSTLGFVFCIVSPAFWASKKSISTARAKFSTFWHFVPTLITFKSFLVFKCWCLIHQPYHPLHHPLAHLNPHPFQVLIQRPSNLNWQSLHCQLLFPWYQKSVVAGN